MPGQPSDPGSDTTDSLDEGRLKLSTGSNQFNLRRFLTYYNLSVVIARGVGKDCVTDGLNTQDTVATQGGNVYV